MEAEKIDLDFLIDAKKIPEREWGEEHPDEFEDQVLHLEESDKPFPESEFKDLSFLVSKKVGEDAEFELEPGAESVKVVDVRPPKEQTQSEEPNHAIDEPLILPKEHEGEKIKVVDITPPADLVQTNHSALEFDEPLILPKEPDSDKKEVEQSDSASDESKSLSENFQEEPLILPRPSHPGESADSIDRTSEVQVAREVSEFRLESVEEKDLTAGAVVEARQSELTAEDVEESLIQPRKASEQKWRREKQEFDSKTVEKKSQEVNTTTGPSKENIFTKSISITSLFENSRLLGLDIGTNSLKYIILKKSARGLCLVDCGIRPIPPVSIDASEDEKKSQLVELLQANLKRKALKNTLITSVVAGLEVLFLNIRVPKLSGKELGQAVRWSCKKDIPFPVESTIIEHQILEKKEKKSDGKLDVLVVAAHENLISKHLDLLNGAHITPTKVSTVPVALLNLFKMLVKKEADKCYAIIDIGAKSSHIVFINQGQLQFTREIATAGGEFTEALSGVVFIEGTEITISKSRADQIKRQYGFPDEKSEGRTKEGIPLKEISVMMRPILERLVNEIQRTIDFYREKFRVDHLEKVFLTGGGALLENLAPNLSGKLNLEVEILSPFQIISTKKILNSEQLEKIGPRFAVAVGLALDRKKEFNLLPPSLRDSNILQLFKKVFRYLFLLVVLVMVLLSQNIIETVEQVEKQFKRVRVEYKKFEPKRKRYLELQNKLGALKAKNKIYKNEIAVNLSAANHLKVMSHLIPPNIALTSLRIEYRNAKAADKDNDFIEQEIIIMQGVAFADNSMEGINLAKFLLELERSNYFAGIVLKNQKIRKDGNLEFTLECQT
jgi:type IV pilus assembly protein PilM